MINLFNAESHVVARMSVWHTGGVERTIGFGEFGTTSKRTTAPTAATPSSPVFQF